MTDSLLVVVALGIVPFVLLATTSFAKLSIVLGILRSALAAGQVPSEAVVILLAGMLTGYVMLPVARAVSSAAAPQLSQVDLRAPLAADGGKALWRALESGQPPLVDFLVRNSGERERSTFLELLRQRLPESARAELSERDLAVVVPAFFVTELEEALQLGFLLLLPFLVLDLVVASILGSLGMQILPASAVSLPFKLLLFVTVDGFRTLSEALVAGYR